MAANAQSANSADRPPDLSIVIVNHNSWDDVERLVCELAKAPEVSDGRCEVVVVDNGSIEPMPLRLAECPGLVRFISRGDNAGFAAGVNTGWRVAGGRWILLLNPDIVAQPRHVGQILARAGRHEARGGAMPGIVGFALRNADGTAQPSVGAEVGLVRSVLELFLPRSRRKYKAGCSRRAGRVPWVTGACALVDRRVLESLGGMDEDFFLYYEEVALCRAARRLGRAVEFDPTVQVVHLRPLQNRAASPSMRVVTRHSRLLYFMKYGGPLRFRVMARLTLLEAAVRRVACALLGRPTECEAWRLVGEMTQEFRAGRPIRGTAVRDLADSLSPLDNDSHAGQRLRRRTALPLAGARR